MNIPKQIPASELYMHVLYGCGHIWCDSKMYLVQSIDLVIFSLSPKKLFLPSLSQEVAMPAA